MNIARAELRDSFEKEVNNIWNIVRSDKDKMFSIRVNDDYDYEMITKVEETGELSQYNIPEVINHFWQHIVLP